VESSLVLSIVECWLSFIFTIVTDSVQVRNPSIWNWKMSKIELMSQIVQSDQTSNLFRLQLIGQIRLSVQTSTDWSNWAIWSDFNLWVKLGNLIKLQLMGQLGLSVQTSTDWSNWAICSDFNWLVKLGNLIKL
jgi:hypothetical protein